MMKVLFHVQGPVVVCRVFVRGAFVGSLNFPVDQWPGVMQHFVSANTEFVDESRAPALRGDVLRSPGVLKILILVLLALPAGAQTIDVRSSGCRAAAAAPWTCDAGHV